MKSRDRIRRDRRYRYEALERPRLFRRRRPTLTGPLFGWSDHYDPIVRRVAPKFARGAKVRLFVRARWRQIGLGIAVLATLAAMLSCGYL